MNIISWNINGLRSSADKFLEYVKNTNYNFYCLQEVRADYNQIPFDLLNAGNYKLVLNSSKKKGYSGVAVYCKNEPKNIQKIINFNKFDMDGRFLQLDYDNFSLINVYIPNGGRKKEFFEYKFDTYKFLFDYIKKKKKTIICGDFNIAHEDIDLARPKDNQNNTMFTPKEREIIDGLLKLKYIDTFRVDHSGGGYYSWWYNFHNARERNIGWRIDYIFISEDLLPNFDKSFISSGIMGSDHCPVGISINLDF
ncbi:exodeoxyribonuclease III [candidate division WWE3 bacterium RBG_19FT_COMBO_34_6]|uniref:Exodeoxyribonuclease III n=1 Tax=candidate division WWE3 bacterium RBG_19FT_COMBO_34_6 TaxID=1802612 RepID=A0A1F4ULS8_UNCKA|nr:MAG: exodeoxyribonuclease III [candidate division WWE3 bacterium RBG_19FT_COMBO_34_6]